ncbi:MAG: class I SAM-dependent methyltransferase [Bacteroidales bacterium]|nr:class I SAM-dependent methyltransferase [Bacteroidales bacterium]MCF8403358.1 class I SAM-dependent methyltransferase [Bacteroidales bacterium]
MNEFWDTRYRTDEYAYGIEPNAFFKSKINLLKQGKILFPAEGEGRNAIYAAKHGFEAFAFDPSRVGRIKALKLADRNNVKINYQLNSYETIEYPPHHFEAIVLIFAHMPPLLRKKWHNKLLPFLKPGGYIILEGFSKEQLNYKSGGPGSIEMLFSMEEIKEDFTDLKVVEIEEKIILLNEGPNHQGEAAVVRAIFQKV